MKKLNLHALFIFAIILMLVQGCSKKDDSSPTAPSTPSTPPTAPTINFRGPQTSSQDTYAQLTVTYATMFNGFSGLFAPLSSSQGAWVGNTWTWSVTSGTLTVTYTCTRQTDGSYTWKCTLNGTDSPHVYTNFTVWEGMVNAANNGGSWSVYDEDATAAGVKSVEYTWATDGSGVLTGTFKGYDNGVLSVRYVVTNNTNGSGEVNFYDGTVLVYKATWTATGTGQWWIYDSSTGTQSNAGTWS